VSSRMLALCTVMFQAVGSTAAAHDFWVQPTDFWIESHAVMPLTLQVGHGPLRQRSPIRLGRITSAYAVAGDGMKIDLRSKLHPGGEQDDGVIHFDTPGVYMLVLQTDNKAQSHLPAIRFNDYLDVEGLTPALEFRKSTRRTAVDGSESYSRHAKSIVQVGRIEGSQAQITAPVGLPLEIIPEVSPYAAPRPTQLPVRIVYEGRPLSGALVKFTNLEHDEAPVATHVTDRDGRARFDMPTRGSWLLNVIWTKCLPASSETDFETYFSSLSFGFPVARQ
jgi:uncharacterized GH25 family protein